MHNCITWRKTYDMQLIKKIRKAVSPVFIQDITWEMRHKLTAKPSVPNLTWALPNDISTRLHIKWPKSYSWPHADKWLKTMRQGLKEHVALSIEDIKQPKGTKASIIFNYKGEDFPIIIDYSDYMPADEELANNSHIYFKMQHSKSGYSSNKIVPGGYIPNDSSLYQYLPTLWHKTITNPKFEAYGRFGTKTGGDIRREAMQLLTSQKKFKFHGSDGTFVRYSRFLRESTNSSVVIDLPGNGDLCFRLIDYMAIGCCIVAPEHSVVLHTPLEHQTHIHFCNKNLADFIDSCVFYLKNENERLRLKSNSREFFMKYLHRTQLSAYYIYNFLQSIKELK